MAKILFACYRNRDAGPKLTAIGQRLARRVFPDTSEPPQINVNQGDGVESLVVVPTSGVHCSGCQMAVGNLEGTADEWFRVGATAPEGAYAIVRHDPDVVELLSDCLASRTLWYIHTPDLFLASNSIRAIICIAGDFQLRDDVVPWVLSSGTLGPYYGWDRRIGMVPPSSVVSLDRKGWHLTTNSVPIDYQSPRRRSFAECREELAEATRETYEKLGLDLQNWVLALSGGYDSRCSFAHLTRLGGIRCITWGHPESIQEPGSDAYTAQTLARTYGQTHEYHSLNDAESTPSGLLDCFVRHHDGRIDHLNGAADGYGRYRAMRRRGIHGLIRTDVGFSTRRIAFARDLYRQLEIQRVEDYANLPRLLDNQFDPQTIPDSLARQTGESISQWRDRVYQEFRIPVVQAALADARLFYIEQANPMLTRRIIRVIRGIPDSFREQKRVLKAVVDDLIPDVPIAQFSSLQNVAQLVRSPEAIEDMIGMIDGEGTASVLPKKLRTRVLQHLIQMQKFGHTGGTQSIRKAGGSLELFKAVARKRPEPVQRGGRLMKSMWRRSNPPNLDPLVLAFRCYIIARMVQILREDAQFAEQSMSTP